MVNPFKSAYLWTLDKIKQGIDIAKSIRRPMTFYVIVTALSFWSLWGLMPGDENYVDIPLGTTLLAGGYFAVIITCCVMVFKFGKERLKADPHYLEKPSDHE